MQRRPFWEWVCLFKKVKSSRKTQDGRTKNQEPGGLFHVPAVKDNSHEPVRQEKYLPDNAEADAISPHEHRQYVMKSKKSLLAPGGTSSSGEEGKEHITSHISEREYSDMGDEKEDFPNGQIGELSVVESANIGGGEDFSIGGTHGFGIVSPEYDQHDNSMFSDDRGNSENDGYECNNASRVSARGEQSLENQYRTHGFVNKNSSRDEIKPEIADRAHYALAKILSPNYQETKIGERTHEVFVHQNRHLCNEKINGTSFNGSHESSQPTTTKCNFVAKQNQPSLAEPPPAGAFVKQGMRKGPLMVKDLEQPCSNTPSGRRQESESLPTSDASPERGNPFTPSILGHNKRHRGDNKNTNKSPRGLLLSNKNREQQRYIIHTKGNHIGKSQQVRLGRLSPQEYGPNRGVQFLAIFEQESRL